MARLRFQSKKIVYEVISELKFHKRGTIRQRTLYGSEYDVGEREILRRARANIMHKFEESGGTIVSLKIKAVYK